ncbi:MAG: hypothetical protein HY717_19000 [Planctomycetes bacterium]|nr:hypothetical protein [Planctomycetota bacterium]
MDCPIPVRTVTITKPTDKTLIWSVNGGNYDFALDFSPYTGKLGPGESVTIAIAFECNVFSSFDTSVTFSATTEDGSAQDSASFDLHADIQRLGPSVLLYTSLSEEFQVYDVISLSRIQGGRINPPDGGCKVLHLHSEAGTITIDGKGPFPDPGPGGCGYGEIIPP